MVCMYIFFTPHKCSSSAKRSYCNWILFLFFWFCFACFCLIFKFFFVSFFGFVHSKTA
uniref:Uncharacterized protein n=1 Tax=Anguilla anguilla TaxID=7936 RepID=A0A0E9W500_ANGAN